MEKLYLNLVNPSKSTINYTKTKYPDEQLFVSVKPENNPDLNPNREVVIVSRCTKFSDLELVAAAVSALKDLDIKYMELFIPYLPGARSDRRFDIGDTNYLVDVIAPFINQLDFLKVHVYDVHSSVAQACIRNLKNTPNSSLVEFALQDIGNSNPILLVSPDAGAVSKIYKLNTGMDVLESAKHRDKSGKLKGFSVPLKPEDINKTLVWVDDLCDGGGTFIGEAEEADRQGHKGLKYLVVSHGVFSNEFKSLEKHFNCIYTTNSYKEYNSSYFEALQYYNGGKIPNVKIIDIYDMK